jgi:hypothetical protein
VVSIDASASTRTAREPLPDTGFGPIERNHSLRPTV